MSDEQIDIGVLEESGVMNKILDNLYLGSNVCSLIYNHMDLVINLDYPHNLVDENDIKYRKITDIYNGEIETLTQFSDLEKLLVCVGIRDHPNSNIQSFFSDLIVLIDDFLNKSKKVLIHCRAGVSRSASVVIAYIMYSYNLDYKSAYIFVKNQRDVVKPNKGFLTQLSEFSLQLE